MNKTKSKVADTVTTDKYQLYNGDSVQVCKGIPDEKVGFIVYSPPFESLFVYSDDPRDISNCKSSEEFWTHYKFLIKETVRILQPGRLIAIHCMQIPSSKSFHGFIGLRDFRGDIIRAHQECGMIYHSEVMIRKDPVVAMQRTKSLGLLHKQIKKDSTMSRMAIADYVVVMRKPGENENPVSGKFKQYHGTDEITDPKDFSISVWQRYAEPMWLDINQNDTLSFREAREVQDERHIAPLQLTVIRRCMELWSNQGDVVLSPFAGIGSECFVAIQMKRKAIGIELKQSYFKQAVRNCEKAASEKYLFTPKGE